MNQGVQISEYLSSLTLTILAESVMKKSMDYQNATDATVAIPDKSQDELSTAEYDEPRKSTECIPEIKAMIIFSSLKNSSGIFDCGRC